jgi:hypothetical protein
VMDGGAAIVDYVLAGTHYDDGSYIFFDSREEEPLCHVRSTLTPREPTKQLNCP